MRDLPEAAVPIVLDIETEPNTEWIEATHDRWAEDLRAPSNYRKPEAIAEWRAEKAASRVQGRGPEPAGRPNQRLGGRDPMGRRSAASARRARPGAGRDRRPARRGRAMLAGFAIATFDLPFIAARAAVHDIDLPSWWPWRWYYPHVLDAKHALREGRLTQWLGLMGLPPKLGDGADAPGMPDEQLLAYVQRDVECERALLRRVFG